MHYYRKEDHMYINKGFNSWRERNNSKVYASRASLVVQWLRVRLPMQGTRVRALVLREDPTCRGAPKPVRHNYWACALELASHNYLTHAPQLLKPACLEPVLLNKRSHHSEKPAQHFSTTKSSSHLPQPEKAHAQQRRPNTAINK